MPRVPQRLLRRRQALPQPLTPYIADGVHANHGTCHATASCDKGFSRDGSLLKLHRQSRSTQMACRCTAVVRKKDFRRKTWPTSVTATAHACANGSECPIASKVAVGQLKTLVLGFRQSLLVNPAGGQGGPRSRPAGAALCSQRFVSIGEGGYCRLRPFSRLFS